ncbi:MAG: nitroreductase family protein, partial [Actinomycetota bacterium]|nr:nitroreductase family protein [Actinomycetota bacterium]
DAIGVRHSRRSYDGTRLSDAEQQALTQCCERFRPYRDARVVFVPEPTSDVFLGVVGSYGKVTNAPSVLVFVGDTRDPYSDQHVGYTGEGLILEATRLGLDTCWVGGFFRPKAAAALVDLAVGERIIAVSPVGRALTADSGSERVLRRLAGAKRRKPLDVIAPGVGEAWPAWAVAGVEAARVAPSAMNREPWRFAYTGDGIVLSVSHSPQTPRVTKELDCGIAMLHFELGARFAGCEGAWEDLAGRAVAVWRPAPITWLYR